MIKPTNYQTDDYFKMDRGRVRMTLCSELWVGGGNTSFRANREGIFCGANNYTNAPFKVNYAGIVSLNGNSGSASINFLNSSTLQGFIRPDSSKNLVIGSNSSVYFTDLSGNPNVQIAGDGSYNMSNGAAQINWATGRSIYQDGSAIRIAGDLAPGSDYGNDCGTTSRRWNNLRAKYVTAQTQFQLGSATGQSFADEVVTSVYWKNGTDLWIKTRVYTFSGGICTGRGSENSRQP